MALTSTPVAQDLLSVLAELAERDHPDFGPWCRQADAEAVRSAVIDRSEDLRKLIDQAVRLIRLAALASEADYTEFIYVAVPALRPRLFKAAVEKARRSGCLPSSLVDIRVDAIRLCEPTMALHANLAEKGYELGYGQMAASTIMLDVLHNTLGYHVVAEVVAGLTIRGPVKVTAREIANDLRSRLNAWLAPRLESAHRRHQAKVLHAFLAGRNELLPGKINDETVLAFWEAQAQRWQLRIAGKNRAAERGARDEGFRVFRSAAIAMFRYRQALFDAADAYALDDASKSEAILAHVQESEAIQARAQWVNPLSILERAPANQIKWLTNRELTWLANFVGVRLTSIATPARDDDETASDGDAGGLMAGRRFDLAFVHTLLRADVFGPIQSGLIAGLKRRQPATETLDRAVSATQEAVFSDAVERYAVIRDQLKTEAFAALHILASAGEPAAVLLIDFLAEAEAMKELRRLADENASQVLPFARPRADRELEGIADGTSGVQELHRIGLTLQNVFEGAFPTRALTELVTQARTARRRVSRSGFKQDDVSNQETITALVKSVPAVLDLLRELNRLLGPLEKLVDAVAADQDRQRFAGVFRLVYSPV
jgi:hypothetical protein